MPDFWLVGKAFFATLSTVIAGVDSFTQESSMIFKPAINEKNVQSTLKKLMTGNDKDGLKYMGGVINTYNKALARKNSSSNQEKLSRTYMYCLVNKLVKRAIIPMSLKNTLRINPYEFVKYVNVTGNNIVPDYFNDLVCINAFAGLYFEEVQEVPGLGYTFFEEVGKSNLPFIKNLVGEKNK